MVHRLALELSGVRIHFLAKYLLDKTTGLSERFVLDSPEWILLRRGNYLA